MGQGIGQYVWSDELIPILRAGLDAGMNFFDTAENYDNGRSERIVGEAIQGYHDVIVGSKFAPEHNSCKDMITSAEGSLRRLRLDSIHLYQLHWPNPTIPLEETAEGFGKLLKDGKIQNAGVCNLSLSDLQKITAMVPIATCQMEYNLFDRWIENTIIPFCQYKNISIIAYSPLDGGRVCPKLFHNTLNQISLKYSKTIAQVALSWIVSKNIMAIPTCRKMEHIIENSGLFNLLSSEINEIDQKCCQPIEYVHPSLIRVSTSGQGNRAVYQTLEQAKNNELNFIPSPLDLSKAIMKDTDIKPVRLVPSVVPGYRFDLVEGRIRYWAWMIFCPNSPIPAYIRDNFGEI